MSYVVVVDGLTGLEDLNKIDDHLAAITRQAVNDTLKFARADSAREIRKQVNFPASYVSDKSGRLSITKYATGRDFTGVIRGRGRPTSLARFSKGTPSSTRKKGGTTVEVSPGSPVFMHRAFLIKLKSGQNGIETKNNLGLALRLRPGESIKNKKIKAVNWRGLAILYGPSVNQVFDDVAEDRSDAYLDKLEAEFNRRVAL